MLHDSAALRSILVFEGNKRVFEDIKEECLINSCKWDGADTDVVGIMLVFSKPDGDELRRHGIERIMTDVGGRKGGYLIEYIPASLATRFKEGSLEHVNIVEHCRTGEKVNLGLHLKPMNLKYLPHSGKFEDTLSRLAEGLVS